MPSVKIYPSVITTVLAWTNPNNAKSDDGLYAVTAGTRNSNHDLIASGFTMPSGTINSVRAEVQYKLSTTASAWTGTLQVQDGATLSGTATTITAEPTVDTIATATGGTALANPKVLFRVRRSSTTTCNYSVDYIALIVDYTEANYNFSGSGTVTATSSETVTGFKSTSGASDVTASQTVTATGEQTIPTYDYQGSGQVTGTGLTQSDGIKEARAPTAITGTAVIESSASKQTTTQGTTQSQTSGQASGEKSATGSSAVTQGASTNSAGSKQSSGIASVEVQSTVEGSYEPQTYDFIGQGSVTSIANVTGAGYKASGGQGIISITSSTQGAGTTTKQATAYVDCVSDISADGSTDRSGSASVESHSTIESGGTSKKVFDIPVDRSTYQKTRHISIYPTGKSVSQYVKDPNATPFIKAGEREVIILDN